MEFHIIQIPLWAQLMNVATLAIPVLGFVAAGVFRKSKYADIFPWIGVCVGVLALFGCMAVGPMINYENNTSFSRQLMDEYHVTSNRALSSIDADFDKSGSSNADFTTSDGKSTPVSIKRVQRDDNLIAMEFRTADGEYPKPSK